MRLAAHLFQAKGLRKWAEENVLICWSQWQRADGYPGLPKGMRAVLPEFLTRSPRRLIESVVQGTGGGGSLFEDVHRRDWSLVMCQLQSGPPGVCGSTTGTNTPGSDRNTRKTGQRMLSAGDMAVSGLWPATTYRGRTPVTRTHVPSVQFAHLSDTETFSDQAPTRAASSRKTTKKLEPRTPKNVYRDP